MFLEILKYHTWSTCIIQREQGTTSIIFWNDKLGTFQIVFGPMDQHFILNKWERTMFFPSKCMYDESQNCIN